MALAHAAAHAATFPPLTPMWAMVAEAGLLDSARAGDERALGELYRRHAGRVLAVARTRLGADALAEDAAQDAWICAFKALPRFRGEAAFGTWIYRIAVNTAELARRRRARWQAVHSPLPERVTAPAPSSGTVVPADLRQAIHALPHGMRQVLALHVEGYTHREIGARLGMSESTSKSQLSRARRKLRDDLTMTHSRPPAGRPAGTDG